MAIAVAVISAVGAGAAGSMAAGAAVAAGWGTVGTLAAGVVAGAVAGGVISAAGAAIMGKDIGDGFKSGALTGAISGGIGGFAKLGSAASAGSSSNVINSGAGFDKFVEDRTMSSMASSGGKTSGLLSSAVAPAQANQAVLSSQQAPVVASTSRSPITMAAQGGGKAIKAGWNTITGTWDKMGDFSKMTTMNLAGNALSGMGQQKAQEAAYEQQKKDEEERRARMNNFVGIDMSKYRMPTLTGSLTS